MNAVPHFLTDFLSLPDGMEFALRRNAQPAPAGTELHYHDHYELLFCLTGQLNYQVEGRTYRLEPGAVLLIHPYQLHHTLPNDSGSVERIALRFEESVLRSRSTPEWPLLDMMHTTAPAHGNLLQLSGLRFQQINDILSALLRENNSDEFGRTLMQQTLLTQLFLCIDCATRATPMPLPPVTADEQLVQQVIEYFEHHLSDTVSLDALARQFYTDRYSLSRAFTRLVGCPPHTYLTQKRLQKATMLLQAGVTPQAAALQCGFPDYSNFYRRFKAAFGVSPREWQSTHT